MTDEAIVELYWNREERAIEESARHYGRYCHRIAKNILYSEEDSEECVNDTWLRAWDSIPPHRPSLFRAFLGKLCRNLALNRYEFLRAEKRGGGELPLALDELSDCIGRASEMERLPDRMLLMDCLNRFLAQEEETSRRIFLRRYWYLCPVREIAEELGYTESKVKMSLLRARKRLRTLLEKEEITV